MTLVMMELEALVVVEVDPLRPYTDPDGRVEERGSGVVIITYPT